MIRFTSFRLAFVAAGALSLSTSTAITDTSRAVEPYTAAGEAANSQAVSNLAAAGQAAQPAAAAVSKCSAQNEVWFLSGSLPAKSRLGEPVEWTVSMKSRYPEIMEIPQQGEMISGWRLRLVNRITGRECKFSQHGNFHFGDNLQMFGTYVWCIKPGEERTWKLKNLLEYFEEVSPGIYELQAGRIYGTKDGLLSETVLSFLFEVEGR
jgi:hypothetical protein